MTKSVYPLTSLQQGMLFHSLSAPHAGVDLLQVECGAAGPVDPERLRSAWSDASARHAVLRTCFTWTEPGDPAQQASSDYAIDFTDSDWRDAAPGELDGRMEAWLEEDRRRGIDLSTPPPWRVHLFRLADDAWRMVWTIHHAVIDGRSIQLVLDEVFAHYEALREGRPAPERPAPRPFADYVAWLAGRDTTADEAYWRGVLEGFAAPTPLPASFGRAADGHGRRHLRLSAAATDALRALASAQGATMNTLVQAAWALVLAQNAGTDEAVFGSVRGGRHWGPGAADAVGLFINTVPVRLAVPPRATVAEWLRDVRRAGMALRGHEHLPLTQIRRCADVPGDTPLFESILNFEPASLGEAMRRRGGGWAERETRLLTRTGFPLTLTVYAEDEMLLRADFARARLDDGGADALLRQVAAALAGMTAAPERPVAELPLLDDGERARAVHGWNRTARAFPAETLHARFEAWADRTPGAPALADEGGVLMYAQAEAAANRLANHLRARGVGPETRVAVCLERSAELAVALLAVLKAGGAYVPLDPEHPADRRAYVLENSGAALLVARNTIFSGLQTHIVDTVWLDRDAQAIASAPADRPAPAAGPGNLAYVIYTSGSTGRAKGVGVEHRQICNYVRGMEERLELPAGAAYGMVSTPAADLGHTVLFAALATGGCLHLVSAARAADPDGLAAYFRANPVDVLKVVPSHLSALLTAADGAAVLPRRTLVLGGEASRRAWVNELRARAPGCAVVNHYGPTETTVGALTHRVHEAEGDVEGTVPLGLPIANARAYVLDGGMRPLPSGVPGELFIGGAGVARGYLGRPGMTAERFLPDPFSIDPGARMYATGDRVRRLEGGALEFLGRTDFQVKIRGYRVEPGEVEDALRAHPTVRDAVVVPRGEGGETRLVGYVTAAAGAALSVDALREHVRARLPEAMVPSAWVVLDALPLTPNGKVDRRALPAPAEEAPASAGYVAPRTPREEVLAGIWAEVLGLPRVGVHDGFFHLGGHSLLAMRVASRVQRALGVRMTPRLLFDAPTVARLAARLQGGEVAAEAAPIVRVPRDGPLPLSFAQERLWFLHRLEPESAAYNVPAVIRLRGSLDRGVLSRALDEIVRRHEALRTTFAADGDEAAQTIHPPASLPLPLEDLSALPADTRDSALARRAGDEARRPFDLGAGPLLRAVLVRMAADDHALLLCMHHVASDGWSVGVFFGELAALYGAFAAGEASPLPEPPVQYADYAAWQRAHLAGAALEGMAARWTERLRGALALLELPTDRPRPAVQRNRGARHRFRWTPALTAAVRAAARAEDCTPFMVVLAGFAAVLGRWARTEDVVIGTPVAGRTRPEVEGLLGFFVNTLALRTDLSGAPDFRALLGRVREASLAAFEDGELPFEKLVEALGTPRHRAHHPVFQVMLAFQNAPDAGVELPGLEMRRDEEESGTAKFDLSLTLFDRADALDGYVEYDTDLFDAATPAALEEQLRTLLEAAAAAPQTPVADLPLVSDAERARMRAAHAASDFAVEPGVAHALFAEQARVAPERAAILHGGRTTTYGELDARANRIAHHLRALGVGAERTVGVCLERTPELVAALFGVLKGGGAYVPLDPAYPAARLGGMLRDSGARVVLTAGRAADALPPADGVRVVRLDDEAAEIAARPADALPSSAHPASLAHAIYTSGSTGRPKGVAIEHRSVSILLQWLRRVLPLAPGERVLAATSVSFDVHVAEMHNALSQGATLVLVENALALAEPGVGDGLAQASMVPAAAAELVRMGAFPPVPRVILGGEPVPPSLARALYEAGVGEVVNAYGPTEDTTYSTLAWIPRGAERVRVGRPVGGTRAHVLDPALRPLPAGVAGELYLAGAGLSRGYLGGPAATAERYLPDPFSSVPGARTYRTGDLARRLADGELEVIGRMDQQVKVRGFRVETGEVESALAAHPALRAAAVTAREDAPGDRRLVAYVIPRDDGRMPPAAELKAFLRASLPDYMVPSAFVPLDAFPRTGSGKVDRRALPAPDASLLERAPEHVLPRTPMEHAVAQVWAEVLGIDRVGAHDDFFALGGHSLLAARSVSRLRREHGVELSLGAFFDHPVLEALARAATAAPAAPEEPAMQALARGGDSLEDILAALEGMSLEEAEALLSAVAEGG
jgi:amino acid adenylation domain-containing protein